ARGTEGVSLRDLAARAHTTTAAVYTLFGSRSALLQAVTDEAFARFAQYLDEVGPSADPRQDLLDLGLAYRRSAMADPHFYRVMFSSPGGSSEHSDSLTEPTFDTLRRAVARVLPAADAERTALEALRLWPWCTVWSASTCPVYCRDPSRHARIATAACCSCIRSRTAQAAEPPLARPADPAAEAGSAAASQDSTTTGMIIGRRRSLLEAKR